MAKRMITLANSVIKLQQKAVDFNVAVTHYRIKVTDAERTEKMRKMFIRWWKSSLCGEARRGSL